MQGRYGDPLELWRVFFVWIFTMTTHELLLSIVRRLPTDYADYGGQVVRWADDNASYPDCSCGCRWAEWLKDELGSDWCVCTKSEAPRAGLLTFEHMAGYDCFEADAPTLPPEADDLGQF